MTRLLLAALYITAAYPSSAQSADASLQVSATVVERVAPRTFTGTIVVNGRPYHVVEWWF